MYNDADNQIPFGTNQSRHVVDPSGSNMHHQSDTKYYEKHAYLMQDPSQKITDSMLEGRVKPDGNLESWARSRSTNLLDSEDPSAKMIHNSRSDYILNSRQD